MIYSMYEKYLTEEFKARCGRGGIEIEHVHTSGHATVDDLQAFAGALNPKTTIPIHAFFADKYKELFRSVEVLEDGQAFDV